MNFMSILSMLGKLITSILGLISQQNKTTEDESLRRNAQAAQQDAIVAKQSQEELEQIKRSQDQKKTAREKAIDEFSEWDK